ncbi:MAG: OprO/OprP family phosphate-selective porin [Spirosomaceae bacterium]|nr:OprO/OprP family phosphate-selective porin [Spirosomataceae bacterium]
MKIKIASLGLATLLLPILTHAIETPAFLKDSTTKEVKKQWFETFSIRGYMQVRYNRLLETNPQLKCEQCDRSIGDGGGFFVRRMRIIFSGNVGERVYFYVQPDFASSASSTGLHFGQIRDMYVDVALDKKKEYRFRIGQSKVPFGFENMQSSQNRLPLDRNDALNSAVSNERDLGIFFYYAPDKIRRLFASLVADGLKGSGDYGVLGLGVYNGQTANRPELNNQPHAVARLAYPFEFKNGQIIEPSIQAYTGKYVLPTDVRSAGIKGTPDFSYLDQRVAATFVLYPKPFGIQAEYNIGTGPEYNKITKSVENQPLRGGYITGSYLLKKQKHIFIPFVRGQYYNGGKKHELDARSYRVKELELGVEWQPNRNFELVTMYTVSERRFEDLRNSENFQKGALLRLQAQLNF